MESIFTKYKTKNKVYLINQGVLQIFLSITLGALAHRGIHLSSSHDLVLSTLAIFAFVLLVLLF